MASSCTEKGQIGCQEGFLHRKGDWALGSGGIAVPGGILEMRGHGTHGDVVQW